MTPAGRYWLLLTTAGALAAGLTLAHAQQEPQRGASSYMPVDIKEPSPRSWREWKRRSRRSRSGRPLLKERYDLGNRAAAGVTMSRGKPLQEGVRVKLPAGMTWEKLAGHEPGRRSATGTCSPQGFLPLPHPNHPEGGMVFPQVPDRRDQEAGGPRPHPLRPRLRPARPLPARVPAAHLPDDAARPRRRVAGQAGHASRTTTSCSTASSTPSSSKGCGCW